MRRAAVAETAAHHAVEVARPVVAAVYGVALNATGTATGLNGILAALMTRAIAAFA